MARRRITQSSRISDIAMCLRRRYQPSEKEDFTGIALYSDVEETGEPENRARGCEPPYFNTRWGLKVIFLMCRPTVLREMNAWDGLGTLRSFHRQVCYLTDPYAFMQNIFTICTRNSWILTEKFRMSFRLRVTKYSLRLGRCGCHYSVEPLLLLRGSFYSEGSV